MAKSSKDSKKKQAPAKPVKTGAKAKSAPSAKVKAAPKPAARPRQAAPSPAEPVKAGPSAKNPTRRATPQVVMTMNHDEIARRAYLIWQRRGCPQGQDHQNWLEAEQELKTQASSR